MLATVGITVRRGDPNLSMSISPPGERQRRMPDDKVYKPLNL